MKWLVRLGLSLLVTSSLSPAEVYAQRTGKVAIGANVSAKLAGSSHAHGHNGVGLLWRLGHGREGWGWKYGINWFSAEIDRSLGGESQEFGKLRIRPILGGYGYTHVMGNKKVSANLTGGYAFTSFSMHDSFDQAYRLTHSLGSIDTSSANTFVLKPEVSTWIDLSEKIGLNISASYMVARPQVTVISSLGRDRQRIHADMFSIKAGLVYSVF